MKRVGRKWGPATGRSRPGAPSSSFNSRQARFPGILRNRSLPVAAVMTWVWPLGHEGFGPLPSYAIAENGNAEVAIRFLDVASSTRFKYPTTNGVTGRKYFPRPMCGGVAILDYDPDGKQDIFFTSGANLPELEKTDSSFYSCLLRNKGKGRFEDVTENAGVTGAELDFSFGIAAGNYDIDGYPDLFVCTAATPCTTTPEMVPSERLRQKLDRPADVLGVAAVRLDYDNGGRLDLVVSQYTLLESDE